MATALALVFPVVLTPYGHRLGDRALAGSADAERTAIILALLAAVMGLNLLAMLFARKILVGGVMIVLQVLGRGTRRSAGRLGHRVAWSAGLRQLGVL
jgi:hypothetical protein